MSTSERVTNESTVIALLVVWLRMLTVYVTVPAGRYGRVLSRVTVTLRFSAGLLKNKASPFGSKNVIVVGVSAKSGGL